MTCHKCNDTKWYQYDYNHSTICNIYCKHDKGYFYLTKAYGYPGKWCCVAGCGLILTYKEVIKVLRKEANIKPIFIGVSHN